MTPETSTRLKTIVATVPISDAERRLRALEQDTRAARGVVTLAAGQAEGEVTGLGLAFTPTRVESLVMHLPAGGLSLTAVAVGTPTADGFGWRLLNGVPDNGNYSFTWTLK